MKILLVEDQKHMAYAIEHVLKKNKFILDIAFDGLEALDYIKNSSYDVIILDVMLPKIDGFTVLKRIREKDFETHIIMLTARCDLEDKLNGLNSGADDYIVKPFEMDELIARINSVTRRKGVIGTNVLEYEGLYLNKDTLELYSGKDIFILTAKEQLLMELFLSKPNIVISKDTIINKIWALDKVVVDNNVEVYISFLRKKLENLNTTVKIKTVRGVGYKLVNDV